MSFVNLLSGAQVNNATARVMTNKKMTTPYSNGEGIAALPYGNKSSHVWYIHTEAGTTLF